MTAPKKRPGLFFGACWLVALLATCERQPEVRRVGIEDALDLAAEFLLSRQSDDGAWRSETYGALTGGVSLTPPVLKTLLLGPRSPQRTAACARAAAYLRGLVDEDGSIAAQDALDYPVYSAAMAAIVLNRMVVDSAGSIDEATLLARDAWLDYLGGFQLNDRLGWSPDDVSYGGWGYSVRPPRKPGSGKLPFEADISSTLMAVGALRLAGVPPEDPAIRDALIFVERCQNFSADTAQSDPDYDDGGFFFTVSNRVQNKAGVSGTDQNGARRYHSYGSPTADGVRALVRCGLAHDHPRVLAARAWLERNFSARTNPGIFEPALAPDRDAALNYWCWSVSHALRLLGVTTVGQGSTQTHWAPMLAYELLGRQLPDGSWRNPYSFMKEDDPLIATTLAAAALANCREVMDMSQSTRLPRSPGTGDIQWIDLVPEMIQPRRPLPPGRPGLSKPLYDRVEEFDAIVLVTRVDSRVLKVREGVFCAVTRVRADEVLKGDRSMQGRLLDIAWYRWNDRALLEKVLLSDLGPATGIVGLRALPDGAPLEYVQSWFHVPGGEDWEPVLERFRSRYAATARAGVAERRLTSG